MPCELRKIYPDVIVADTIFGTAASQVVAQWRQDGIGCGVNTRAFQILSTVLHRFAV
jgi:hypothetical protein